MFWHKKNKLEHLKAYVSGEQRLLETINDEVFSSGMMGKGLVILPAEDIIYSPADAIVVSANDDMRHAIGLKFSNGMEVLIHIGLDTVTLNNKGFELLVNQNQSVKEGDPLIRFDNQLILDSGLDNPVILVITNDADVTYEIEKNHQVAAKKGRIMSFN